MWWRWWISFFSALNGQSVSSPTLFSFSQLGCGCEGGPHEVGREPKLSEWSYHAYLRLRKENKYIFRVSKLSQWCSTHRWFGLVYHSHKASLTIKQLLNKHHPKQLGPPCWLPSIEKFTAVALRYRHEDPTPGHLDFTSVGCGADMALETQR